MRHAATRFSDWLRRFLGRRGYVVSYFEAGVPARLESYLRELETRDARFERIQIFDGDPEPLNVFLNVFPARNIQFNSEPGPGNPPPGAAGRLLLEVDRHALSLKADSPLPACLQQAAVVVIRSKIGPFWTGQTDLSELVGTLSHLGLHLRDVLQQLSGPPIGVGGGNVYLAFERDEFRPARPQREREFRVSEALTLLSAPIVPEAALQRLTGRASLGFAAGVFNPGAYSDGRRLFLLARGERAPWPVQKRSRASYLSSCQPVLLTLQDDLQISAAVEVRFPRSPAAAGQRFEDFRLFTHQGVVYSNHCCIQCEGGPPEGAAIRPERFRTSLQISRLDAERSLLTPLGPIVLDRPLARVEKNWAMFSTGDCVHLIYSFSPYRLFSAPGFPEPRFAQRLEHPLHLPLPEDGLTFRNSINPVPWDADFLLHVVHKVFPEKRYVFWAVLLDRRTLLPVKISRRPLVSDRSSGASITYVCSALCRGDDFLLFGGLDDCALGTWRIPRTQLDTHWLPIV